MPTMMMRNAEGEPIGMEYVSDPYEEEIAFCEEMQHRADDPMYAAQCESEYWYNQAVAAFEERGIEVPDDVIYALQRELRRKQQKEEEDKALQEMEPAAKFIESLGYKVERCYDGPTPEEYGYAYMYVYDANGKSITREERNKLIALGHEHDLYLDDYCLY